MSTARSQLLAALLSEYWSSDDWVDPLHPLLDGWSQAQADRPYAPGVASVRQVVNHTAYWEDYLHRATTGASLDDLAQTDEAGEGREPSGMPAWPAAVDRYRGVHEQWRSTVATLDERDWLASPADGHPARQLYVGMAALHAAYHAGQLSLIRQLMELPSAEKAAPTGTAYPTSPVAETGTFYEAWSDMAWQGGELFVGFDELTAAISVEQADGRLNDRVSSMTEMVNHMTFWEAYAARRLRAEDTTDMAKVSPGEAPPDGLPWPEARERLIEQHRDLRETMGTLGDAEWAKPRPGEGKTFEAGRPPHWLACGAILHHAYHMGQLVWLDELHSAS